MYIFQGKVDNDLKKKNEKNVKFDLKDSSPCYEMGEKHNVSKHDKFTGQERIL